MADSLIDRLYKNGVKNPDAQHSPDVLSCLANLSNDEVFTPPEVVNNMLDMLPKELFSDPNTKFLDPACKTGVFLREIAKRLLIGLEPVYPNLQERIDHIFKYQLYGIAITELTSLLSRRSIYCSQYPNGQYSVCKFDSPEGNVRFKKIKHTWKNRRCVYCGADKQKWDRPDDKESHAYEFIHTYKPEEIYKMNFDVVISNPPYQLSDGGQGQSAGPLYHHFVNAAKKLNPRYITMIIPSRWFVGGKGLDQFRKEMLNDQRISKIFDFENYKDIFPGLGGLAGGACYFLWERDHKGQCEVFNCTSKSIESEVRSLNEFPTLIRSNKGLSVVRKILKQYDGKRMLDEVVSSRKPFGLPTNYEPKPSGIPCWFIQKIGKKKASKYDVDDSKGYLNKWKLLAPKAPIAGQTDFSKPVGIYYESNTIIAKPGECCTESFIILGAFETEEEVNAYKSYIFTKPVRFLLLQAVASQDITRRNFSFVPDLGKYEGTYTDEQLYKLWNISKSEQEVIESKILDVKDIGKQFKE